MLRKIICAVLACLLLAGCSMPTVDKLYCLPKRANADSNLQEVIDRAMADLQYSAPVSGSNQQTVQSADLDGDGQDEYLLFAKDNSEKPLKILIFSKIAAGYVLMETIESYGLSFEFVEYANVDDRPGLDVVVGTQVSEKMVRSVSIYRFTSGFALQLMTASYSKLLTADFLDNGHTDLLLIQPGPAEDSAACAVLYTYRQDEIQRSAELSLSMPASQLKRATLGKLADGTQAVFVSSAKDENTLLTDVITADANGALTLLPQQQTQTLRNYYLYPEDIDSDGITEIPVPVQLKQQDGDEDPQFAIDWYELDADGPSRRKLSTYHNPDDGWYIRLDTDWVSSMRVQVTDDQYRFSLQGEQWPEEKLLLSILILTGPNREEQAKQDGLGLLYRGTTEIYVIRYPDDLTEREKRKLLERFRLIRMDWNKDEDREDEYEEGSDSGR